MKPVFVVPMVAWVLLASACSQPPAKVGVASANSSASPGATAASQDDPVGFARCMREHNQNVPDPDRNTPWQPEPPAGQKPEGWDEAMRACVHFLPTFQGPHGPDAQTLEKLRAFAVCMRAHDIEMTDPSSDGRMSIGGRLENVSRTQLENDPGYKAATEACKDKLPDIDPKGKGGK